MKNDTVDLDAYVTDRALDGLFKMVAQEEARIRKDPVAQSTELLKVFGAAYGAKSGGGSWGGEASRVRPQFSLFPPAVAGSEFWLSGTVITEFTPPKGLAAVRFACGSASHFPSATIRYS